MPLIGFGLRMDKDQNEKRLRKVFSAVFHTPEDNLSVNPSMDELVEWDSLTHLRLIMSVEQEFALRFEMEKIANLVSFLALLEEIQNAQRSVVD